jgi:hypothetical protein
MNIYLESARLSFPEITYSSQIQAFGDVRLNNFIGDFAVYNGLESTSGQLSDWPVGNDYTISGNANILSNVHNYSGIDYSNIETNLIGSKVVGPTVELGTVVTSLTLGENSNGTFTTNKPFTFISRPNVSFNLLAANSNVQTYTNLGEGSTITVGSLLFGPKANGINITSVTPNLSNAATGTITTEEPFQSEGASSYTAEPTYRFYPWLGTSTRLVSVIFPTVTFPDDSGSCTITAINNNPTAMTFDGALYGGSVMNMQFPKTDSSTFYASSVNYSGIRRYGVSGNTIVMTDSNSNVPTVNPFAVFPTTSEMVALVPTPASNNIQIYQNVY